MTTIIALNPVDTDHLAEVIESMREMGAPKVRAVFNGSEYLALEASHRLAAAAILGMEPEIIEMAWTDEVPEEIADEMMVRADDYADINAFFATFQHQGETYTF